ncbi:hypothetical protein AX16_005372 [Volvariella volvacea WC 439]|nr:hypothetical protein AX16_005372 [Volvariella volvacea WC 439]
MSTSLTSAADESQVSTVETQMMEMQVADAQAFEKQDDDTQGVNQDRTDAPTEKKKREKREPVELTRERGKSLLPFSRVQKIIKADKDIPIVAKDATFLISLATEEFIKRLAGHAQRVAERENRATVQHKDIGARTTFWHLACLLNEVLPATVVRREDEFLFLEEIIPWTAPTNAPKRDKPKGERKNITTEPTLLDQFVKRNGMEGDDDGDERDGEDIVMNDDGTMTAV